MKLLVLCGLLALGLAASSSYRRHQRELEAEPFRSGREYVYGYKSQIASGIGSTDQHATHLIASTVYVNFETSRIASLRLQDITIGVRNDILAEPRQLYPVQSFDDREIEPELLEALQMPIQFEYVDGLIENVKFNTKDSHWSKNIKRAVLTLLQLNLKRRASDVQGGELDRENSWDDEKAGSLVQMFTLPETTIEGECQTVYTLNNRQDDSETFNVTKSIDFKNCNAQAFLRYGPRVEKQTVQSMHSEADHQQLDRSTVYRYQLSGAPESYGINQVNVISQYVYKLVNAEEQQPMQTIAVAELTLKSQDRKSPRDYTVSDKEESLMYCMERDVAKRNFYRYGDENEDSNPFAKIEKVRVIVNLLGEIAQNSYDFAKGIPTEASIKVEQVIEFLRMCTLTELEKIVSELDRDQRSVFTDILAIAGTRNTVHFLVKGIMNREISAPKAVQALRQVNGLYAVSSKHTDDLLRLCKSSVAKESAALRQSCWLTFGSIVSELCKETSYTTVQEFEEQCPRHLKEKLQKILIDQYADAQTTYEKVLMIKAIGNAAIDNTVHDLEKIINNKREVVIVRQQAIDALRRLRNQMPIKIQRVLMPIFQNTQERPELRMAALSMIMYTIPRKTILDQLTYTLFNERSQHVRSFVYTTLKAYSRSTVEVERELAHHLQTILKMNPMSEEELRWSRFYRIPIYSQEQREGFFLNLASGFASSSVMPQHLSLSIDSLFNDMLETKNFELSLTQSNLEQLLNTVYEQLTSSRFALRPSRYNSMENGRELIENIFEALKTQRRGEKSPFGMLSLRVRDIDHVILPISEELPQMLRDMSLSEVIEAIRERRSFRYNTVASMHERVFKVATIAGLPLRMSHALPIVAGAEGNFKVDFQGKNVRVHLQLKPLINAVHIQKMELWCPIINTGVASYQAIGMNLPVNMQIAASMDSEEKIKITYDLPEEKTRLITFESRPVTFMRSYNRESRLYSDAIIMTLGTPRMDSFMVDLGDEDKTDREIVIQGFYHKPSTPSYRNLYNLMAHTENYVTVDFVPRSSTPKTLELIVKGELFNEVEKSSHRPEFKSFFDSKKFQSLDEDLRDMDYGLESDNVRSSKLNKYIASVYKNNKVYEHFLRATFKTIGGRTQHKTDLHLKATCDSHLTFCKIATEVRASPMENGDWTWNCNGKVLTPHFVNDIEDLKDNAQNNFAFETSCEWGADRKERVTLKVKGERAVSQGWISRKWQRNLATAFVNKYDVIVDYDMKERTKSWVSLSWEMFKMLNYDHVVVDEAIEGKPNEIYTSFVIDPITRTSCNLTVKTPKKFIKLVDLYIPESVKPFPLVRPQDDDSFEVHSSSDLMNKLSDDFHRAECRVDGRKIKTFDSVIYKAPLGQCYSVIAKDCVDKTFAVLMKTLDKNTQQKKLKIVNHRDVIEVYSQFESELVVKINGRKVEDVEELREQGIERSEDMIRVTLPQGVTIRFDGKQATVKLSQYYQDKQCGLCGEFNDEDHDEFRKSDGSLTDDVKTFHQSFTLLKDDEECDVSAHKKLYSNDKLFDMGRDSRKRESDAEYDSGLDLDDDIESYDHFDRKDRREDSDETYEIEPVLRTKVIEFNHKLCFSLKPIKQCPRGTTTEKSEMVKAQLACLKRSAPETRRLLRLARTQDITDELQDAKMSFVEVVKASKTCSQN